MAVKDNKKRNGLTGSGSGHEGDDDGQTEAGEMRRYRGCSPQPHIQPVLPHAQALSHRAVLHIRWHTADTGARCHTSNLPANTPESYQAS